MSQLGGGKVQIDLVSSDQTSPGVDSAQRKVDGLKKSIEGQGPDGGFGPMLKGLSRVREAISKLIIPAAFAAGIVEAIKRLDEFAARAAQASAASAEFTSDVIRDLSRIGRKSLGSEVADQIRELQESTATKLEQSGDKLNETIRRVQDRSVAAQVRDFFQGYRGAQQIKDAEDAAAKEAVGINGNIKLAEERLKLRAKEKKQIEDAKKDAEQTDALNRYQQEEQARESARITRRVEAEIEAQFDRENAHQDEMERIRKETDARIDGYRRSREELEKLIEAQRGLSTLAAAINLGAAAGGRGVDLANIIGRRVGRQ